MSPALVLFDLDGTLLITGGASSRCIRRAARAVLGERFEWSDVTVGTLDPQIFMELAGRCGIENAADCLEAYKSAYLAELEQELQRVRPDVKVMPGVHELLAELSQRPDVVLGLLTGNFRRAAELKLAAAGLDLGLFPVGAFAEDGQQRSDLVAAALGRFEQLTGQPGDVRRTILVGDTPRDIACARDTGCGVLAVATGHYSLAELQAHQPDRGVANLLDARPLWEMIDERLRLPERVADR